MKIKGLAEKINQTLTDKDNTINYLEAEQQKYQALTKEVNQFLTKYNVKSFAQLSNGIQGLLSDRKKYKDERDQAQIEITEKDNRIAQLDQVLKGSALVFQRHQQAIDQLKQELEQEQKNATSPEQAKHLQTDILRLAGERKELNERIAELKIKEELLKEFHDKELAELKKEKNELNDNYNEFVRKVNDKIDEKEVYIPLEATEEEKAFLKLDWINSEFDNLHQQLQKEQTWWDKWIDDKNLVFMKYRNKSAPFVKNYDWLNPWSSLLNTGNNYRIDLKISFPFNKNVQLELALEEELLITSTKEWTRQKQDQLDQKIRQNRKLFKEFIDFYKSLY